MPDLNFQITGVGGATRGATPLLRFELAISNTPAEEVIRSVMLQVQIKMECAKRSYTEDEKAKLSDLFGSPERWGQTLRSRLWTHAHVSVTPFRGRTVAMLPVPCSFDLNLAATKFFYALDGGHVPLLFLFSGTVFYAAPDAALQVQQISWNKECAYEMPVQVWKDIMDAHYPNMAFLYLDREVFDRLYAYKRRHSLPTWDEAIDRLLPDDPEAGSLGGKNGQTQSEEVSS